MPPEISPFAHGAPAQRWMPHVLVLAADPAVQAGAVWVCRRFEPHARVQTSARLAEVLRLVVAGAPDLLLVEPAPCGSQLHALLEQARRQQPAPAVVLVGPEAPQVEPSATGLRADACLAWDDLPLWLAVALPRLRCRAQLAMLHTRSFSDTTRPADLVPTL